MPWWYNESWSYKDGAFYKESIIAVIKPSSWKTSILQSIYLPFIYKHKDNKIRKILINRYSEYG